jgi:GxxExxY protein
MPITTDSPVRILSEDDFKQIAYAVTGAAFSLHREYGSMFAEKLYKYELAAECTKLGLGPVETEMPIHVAFDSFRKDYFADLVVDGGALFELKVAFALTERHRAQTLHYLFLLGLPRAKLLSFRPDTVEHEFVSTTLSSADRRQFVVHKQEWTPCGSADARFAELLLAIVGDWGTFLQLPLYHEAMVYFLGGAENVVAETPVVRNGKAVTTQRVHLLAPDVAFNLTAIAHRLAFVEDHIRRFLAHTRLRAIQWVNFHQHDVTFKTLLNSGGEGGRNRERGEDGGRNMSGRNIQNGIQETNDAHAVSDPNQGLSS